jgi:preprotein translocase subunit SecG
MSFLISLFTVVLIIVSVLLVLIVLMQKTKDGGMGSALGGGVTESTFGAETGNVLSQWTIKLAITFFLLSFALYLGINYVNSKARDTAAAALPTIAVPAAKQAAPEAPAPAAATAPAAKKP